MSADILLVVLCFSYSALPILEFTKMFFKLIFPLLALSLILFTRSSIAQQWTLESSIRQAMSVSPELKISSAEIGARQEDLNLSSLWPDPEIELRVDNELGQDDGSGGYDLMDIKISQAIPLSRTKYQKSVAIANLKATEFSRVHQALLLQNKVSKVFHQLQLVSAEYNLAKKRLQLADEQSRQSQKNTGGIIVRYLTPLEKMRLDIIREEASQAASSAEGKYLETLKEFTKLLVIDADMSTSFSELQPINRLPDIKSLLAMQDEHAQIAGQQQLLLAAKHEIDVARSTQTIDPTISLTRSQVNLANGRHDIYGVIFNVQIPIHDRKSKAESKASFKASEKNIALLQMRRDLRIDLERSFTHLKHVVEQADEYEKKVLLPAKKMLDLTNKGFASGELKILSLVDANKTFFEARLHYLNLLYQAWNELADVQLYAGQLMTDSDTQQISLNQGDH
jgi:cobalt-zinc-cadmium efflux system outer membrane protein